MSGKVNNNIGCNCCTYITFFQYQIQFDDSFIKTRKNYMDFIQNSKLILGGCQFVDVITCSTTVYGVPPCTTKIPFSFNLMSTNWVDLGGKQRETWESVSECSLSLFIWLYFLFFRMVNVISCLSCCVAGSHCREVCRMA